MKEVFSRRRRFALAGCALLAASLAFRSQIATALVVRGDDYMYRNQTLAARIRYARALALEPNLEVAADRYVFVSMETHTTASVQSGIHIASAYLQRRPNDVTLLEDRALCYLIEHEYERAKRDFAQAAQLSRSARDFVFAGWAARHEGQARRARGLWGNALSVDPSYRPARIALAHR